MSENAGPLATATSDDGYSVSSTYETTEQLAETLKPEAKPAKDGDPQPEEKDDDLSEAASKLGKKGGETTAAKRAAEAKEQPDADKAGDAPAATDAEKSKKGNPRHDPTARVAEATRLAAEAKRERDAIKAERDRLAAELEAARSGKPAEQPKAPPKPVDPNAPKLDDFEKYEDYVEAVADYRADQRLRQYQQHQQQREAFTARAITIDKAVKEYVGRIEEAKKADPSFVDRTAPILSRLQPSFLKEPSAPLEPIHVIADEVLRSAQSAALLAHFADNPDALSVLESLQTIPDIQAEVRFLAKSVGSAAAPQATASKPEISKARPPVRPVTGAPVNAGGPDPENSSFDEWIEHQNAREGVRR